MVTPAPIAEILDRITRSMKSELQGQYITKRTDYLSNSPKDRSTIAKETIEMFETKWKNLETRMEIVLGKRTLNQLMGFIQNEYHVNLTHSRIVNAFTPKEIPNDLTLMLRELDRFCSAEL
jgi:hypothetical protein